MRRAHLGIALVGLALLAAPALHAQPPASSSTPAVPRVVRLTGTLVPANGLPPSPVETVTLAIYADEAGGAPLWQETQYVTLDGAGRYSVLLGATQPEGLPGDLFASGEARWLGRRFERSGEPEQARVLLASVPYALKAANADTLGGLPPSAYQLADPRGSGSANASTSLADTAASGANPTQTAASPSPQALTSGTAGCVAEFTNSTDLGCSPMIDAGGAIGLGTATPFDRFHVRFTNTNGAFTGYAVQNLGSTASSYSGMLFYDQNGALGQFQGFNNSTHEYRINNIASGGSINFMLGGTSRLRVRPDGDVEVPGMLRKGGVPFLNNPGYANTFVGLNAGNVSTTGSSNTAVGEAALSSVTWGVLNVAIGPNALAANTEGRDNVAIGPESLSHNTTGTRNVAIGEFALTSNTVGSGNHAVGSQSLFYNTTGSENVANGEFALLRNTTGSYNTGIGGSALQENTTGGSNTAIGGLALSSNTTGFDSTAIGFDALHSNTTGAANVATGSGALYSNTTGSFNTATGRQALSGSSTGYQNTAVGASALLVNTSGHQNTAIGDYSLGNTTGSYNIAIGSEAGRNSTTGSNNIYLGSELYGVAGESNTMYLGVQGTQIKTVIAGIRGITTGVADAIPVMIDSNGQLGTVSSSRRFKEDIHDMGDASRALFALRPVTFRYSQAYTNGAKPIQYGLVAEEVAEVFPDLAVRNANGGVDTVHYETLSVLLLNEVQKQQARIAALEGQQQRHDKQQQRIEALERRLNALLPNAEP